MGRTRKLVLLLHQLANEKPIPAEISSLDELSGHADSGELLQWMKPMTGTLKRVFLVHGEAPQANALAQAIRAEYGIETTVAAPGLAFDLNV